MLWRRVQNTKMNDQQIINRISRSQATSRMENTWSTGAEDLGSSFSASDITRTTEQTETAVDGELPNVNERLAYLRPSRELLEYYRKKIGEFDTEHDEMMKKISEYKMTYEEQHKVQWEIRQREEEITELQKALSDMQVYLFQEREHVLRLYAENDRLKIRELEDRKKIQTLLQLSGLTESEVSYFMKEPPANAIVPQKIPAKLRAQLNKQQAASGTGSRKPSTKPSAKPSGPRLTEEEERKVKDAQTLGLQNEALQAQLEEQTRLARDQLDALMDDRRIKADEYETRRTRDLDKIKIITEKLHKTQDLLYDSTKDFLSLRYEHRTHEKTWMSERDHLLRELDVCKQQANISREPALNTTVDTAAGRGRYDEEIQSLEWQLKQAQKLADMYREQVIQLEDKLSRIREEGEVGKELFKDRSEKMSKRLELMTQRYQDLERRRNLEVEGFRTDIKHLRQKLKEVEKHLYKVTIGFSEDMKEMRPDDIDMQILRNVRHTAGRSKELMGELKTLKSKVYGMENDLRHL